MLSPDTVIESPTSTCDTVRYRWLCSPGTKTAWTAGVWVPVAVAVPLDVALEVAVSLAVAVPLDVALEVALEVAVSLAVEVVLLVGLGDATQVAVTALGLTQDTGVPPVVPVNVNVPAGNVMLHGTSS